MEQVPFNIAPNVWQFAFHFASSRTLANCVHRLIRIHPWLEVGLAAFAALIPDLKDRGLFDSTVVLCGGEFGRTPKMNPVGGRDHWPHAFTVAITGGGIRRGHIVGATDPDGDKKEPEKPVRVQDLHATIQTALGLDPTNELITPVGRPLAPRGGSVIRELLS